jgi:hypothetical protein
VIVEEHPAEALIAELGINSPKNLDIDAIAYDAGVEVHYLTLNGCEATLVGVGRRAIATVKRDALRVRQRFSIGHELGHWHYHRGQSFRCRVDDVSDNLASRERSKEQQADDYAAHLLMPGALIKPLIKQIKNPNFASVKDLGGEFETSILATALRLIDLGTVPAILTCYNAQRLRWFRFSKDVPRRWYLHGELDDDTFAYELLIKGKEQLGLRKSSGESWFANADADEYEVSEHSILGREGEVLTLLLPENSMLDAQYDPDVFPKRTGNNAMSSKRRLR